MKGSSSDAASAAAAASPVATSTLRSIVFANCCLLFVVLSNRLRFASAQPELSTAQQLSLFLFLSLALHLTSLDDAPSLSLSMSFSLAHTCSRPVWSAWQRGLSRQIAETWLAASAELSSRLELGPRPSGHWLRLHQQQMPSGVECFVSYICVWAQRKAMGCRE